MALVLGELTMAQPLAAAEASGIFGAAFALALNGPACLSTDSELPGELATELVISLGGFAAKLSSARNAPAEKKAKASKACGLKIPD